MTFAKTRRHRSGVCCGERVTSGGAHIRSKHMCVTTKFGALPYSKGQYERYRFNTVAVRHERHTAANGRLRICAGLLPAPTIGCPDWAYRDNLLTTPAERIGLSGPAAVGRRSAQRARTSIALNVAQHSARSHERHSGGLFPNQLKSTLSRVRGPCGDMCRWPPPVIFPGAQSEKSTHRAHSARHSTDSIDSSVVALTCPDMS